MLGIAYKKNVKDLRESPAVDLIAMLLEHGARIDYADHHVPVFPLIRRGSFDMRSVEFTPCAPEGYDFVLLAPDHDAFDYVIIGTHARLIIDTRGRYLEPRANPVKA